MSKKHKNRPQDERSSQHRQNPPNHAATFADEGEFWSKQIREARKLNTISTWATIIAALALVGVGINAWLIHRQVGEMQKSDANNFQAFEDTERPWLSVAVAPKSDLYFPRGKQAALTIKVSIKNVGKSIANDIQVNAKLFPTSPGIPFAPGAIQNEGKLCNNPRPEQIGRFYMFPSANPVERDLSISVTPTAIDAKSVTVPGAKPRSFVGLYLVGCVTYRFSFGSEIHQTRFAYRLVGPPIFLPDKKLLMLPNGMPAVEDFEIGVRVPEKNLSLMTALLGKSAAN